MILLILRQTAARLLMAIPILLLVTLATFVMLYSIGDPAAAMAGDGATPEQIEQIRADNGLDRPVVVQYLAWLGALFTGNLGDSMQNRGAVSGLLSQYIPPTLQLTGLALVIAVVVALALGSVVGVRAGGVVDRVGRALSFIGMAIPNFLVGLGLILVFSIWLKWFPAAGYRPPGRVGITGTLEYLVLPAIALALSLICVQIRTFRSSIVSEYRTDYVRTARMKGVSEWGVFFKHVARNASAPLVTVIGLEIGVLITGALLVEVVFAVPGVGTLTIESVRSQDFTVVQALVALFGAVVILANLVADLVALALNPTARSRS